MSNEEASYGRGYLLKIRENQLLKSKAEVGGSFSADNVLEMGVELLKDNPFQPRLRIKESKLNELCETIKKNGLIQPVPVAKLMDGNSVEYVLIAGHRRLAAHKKLGRETIKVHIFEGLSKKDLAAMAMIENIQREDLDLIEIAMQYRALIENKVFDSLSELATAVGKDKADISKTINILKLPLEITEDVRINKSTTDLKVLDAIRKLNNDEQAIKLYKWFISSSVTRDDLIAKVKEMLGKPKEKQNSYEIKNSNKGCVIKLPELNDSELEKVSAFVDGIVKNRG